jgi:hypothetical protein
MANWPGEDEGRLRARDARKYLKKNGHFKDIAVPQSIHLEPGEQCLLATRAKLDKFYVGKYPNSSPKGAFRITVKWAKDPMAAPFLWLFVLPFNLLFKAISNSANNRNTSHWMSKQSGRLVLTDRALVHSSYGRQTRLLWTDFSDVTPAYFRDNEATSPSVGFRCLNEGYCLDVPEVDRLSVALIMAHHGLGEVDRFKI